MRNFEPFTERATPAATEPTITVQSKGTFGVNRAAVDALGKPERVELLFDRAARMIGLRPADASISHSYPLRRQQNSNSYVLGAVAFTHAHGIQTDRARRYPAIMEDGILIVDLNGPSTEVTSNRERGKPSRDQTVAA